MTNHSYFESIWPVEASLEVLLRCPGTARRGEAPGLLRFASRDNTAWTPASLTDTNTGARSPAYLLELWGTGSDELDAGHSLKTSSVFAASSVSLPAGA